MSKVDLMDVMQWLAHASGGRSAVRAWSALSLGPYVGTAVIAAKAELL
jgi:hypothetical protein